VLVRLELASKIVTDLKKQKSREAADKKIPQIAAENAPAGWAEAQSALAAQSGISLLLVEGHQPPALAISNNNSICHALQSSPEHVQLCDPYCGVAHQRAIDRGTVTHYRCHAGLHCFAMPVQLEKNRPLVVIGGRAFLSSADYKTVADRFRVGDLQELVSTEVFRNVIFADEADLDHAALRVEAAAKDLAGQRAPTGAKKRSKASATQAGVSESREADVDILPPEVNRRARSSEISASFIERIDALDPQRTYDLILKESADLLSAERGSLLLYDETANSLAMKAARGIPQPINQVGQIPVGEGIAGIVLREGRPIVARDISALGRAPAPRARQYKTNSFISYPIKIGRRRIGVLNLADKVGGGSYDEVDLSIIESIGPQIALAVERAEWQAKANRFQLMSLTDPLTGLHNRRYLEARLFEEVSRAKRYKHALSFMMIDIDDFKFYNDNNGHQAGDRALEITAHCLTSTVRKIDVASRYGGEEFSILMPQTSIQEASVIADRVRRQVASTPYPNGNQQPLGAVTVSIGLSTFSSVLDSSEKVVRAADRALYHAKKQGKNRAYAYRDMLANNA
jgi:diguanylate cyclase (GGDEF)-like protein